MIAYTNNVLPTDAAYYTLNNATLFDNQLNILAGGSAVINVAPAQLPALTEYFRVTATMSPSSHPYTGGVFIIVKIISLSGKYFTHICNVVTDSSGLFSAEIEAIAEEYISLQVTIQSAYACTFTSWGLEPEASSGDVQVEIDGVKQSLPKLLYDYNTTLVTVGIEEHLVGMISCYLRSNTDLQGHFLMNVNAAERCTIHLRFYDNNMEELFSPQLYTVNAGLTAITVPHAYLHKIVGIHNFSVTAQVSNGSLSIPIRSMLYTIDGGYLAERLLNPGMDIQDIAIQQLPTDDKPTFIYAIGIDNSIINVKRHSYEPRDANEAWEAVYTLGEGVLGAIEFNGVWHRRAGNKFFTLECEDVPWAFWVDNTGTLYGQRGAVTSTLVELSTGVTCVSAIRGYKSEIYLEQDQGMVVAYLKSGTAYYRNYCLQSNGNTIWEPERVLSELGSNLTSIQVHRLNDYRLGFVGSSPTNNKWVITGRTYVAAAVPPETFEYELEGIGGMAIVPIEDAEYDAPIVTTELNENWIDLYLNCQYKLLVRTDFREAFTITRTNDADIIAMDTEGTRLHITLAAVPRGGILTMTPVVGKVMAYMENCGYIAVTGSFVFTFTQRYQGAETFDYNLAVNSVEILLRPLGYFEHPQNETFEYNFIPVVNSIEQKPLIYTEHEQSETFEYNLVVTTLTITASFVGVEPI